MVPDVTGDEEKRLPDTDSCHDKNKLLELHADAPSIKESLRTAAKKKVLPVDCEERMVMSGE